MTGLARQVFGENAAGPALVIAHGLFGSGRNWRAIARALASGRRVVTVDMRNHGASFHESRHDYPAMARDLGEVIADLGGEADLLGHSMGGKAAMALALTRPGVPRRLIVADIAPVAYGHSHAPTLAAMRAIDPTTLSDRAEAAAALRREGIADAATRAFLLQSLVLREGPPRWTLALDALAAAMPDLVGWPDIAGRFEGPALFLSGAASDYVRAEHHDAIGQLFPAARFESIPEAGHWLHAEKPREVIAAVERFLSEE